MQTVWDRRWSFALLLSQQDPGTSLAFRAQSYSHTSHSSLPGGAHSFATSQLQAAFDPVDWGCSFSLAEESIIPKQWQLSGRLTNMGSLFETTWLSQ